MHKEVARQRKLINGAGKGMPLLGERGAYNSCARNEGYCWRFRVGLTRRKGIAIYNWPLTCRLERMLERHKKTAW